MNATEQAAALVIYDDSHQDDERRAFEKMREAMQYTVQQLAGLAATAVQARKVTEERWLENLRQFHGVYESSTASILHGDDSLSSIFVNITRPKTNAWAARLGDMLFPNDEKNWGIDATPIPTLTSKQRELASQIDALEREAMGLVEQHNAMVEEAQQAGMEGVPGTMLQDAQGMLSEMQQLREAAREQQRQIEFARRAARAMERLIDDQLTESNFPGICRSVIDDMVKVGVGILKGPIVNDRPAKRWRQMVDEAGQPIDSMFELVADDAASPRFRRVDYWHFFPDPSAQSMDDCEYTFERHLPNKKMLRRMAREMKFHPSAVATLIKEGPRGHSASGMADLSFMAHLRSLESGTDQTSSGDPLADRYCLWEYHGPLESEQIANMLRVLGDSEQAMAIEQGTALEVPMVRVFFCGSELLKVDPEYILDSGASLYSVATFEKGEASVLGGVGVPHLMRHEQRMLNSAMRMMMDNAALATAPQIVINKKEIAPEDGSWKLKARKVWNWVAGVGSDGNVPPFATFNIPMNQEMLAAIVQLALRFVDEAVAMPLIAQGESGAHITQTAKGMSMLFNSANVGFRRVVKNWDDEVTTGVIRRAYDFNMQFSTRDDVKGDMKVEARGTSVLLVRELQAEQLMGIIREWSAHPILGVGFRAYHSMRMVLQAMSINPDDLLLAEEDYLQKLKQMSDGGEQDPETLRAQTTMEVAKIDAASRENVANINLEAARIRAQTAFAELATNRDISIAQIEAMFEATAFKETTRAEIEARRDRAKERTLAAELGQEERIRREAEARGLVPTGSGGAISAGMERP